METIEEAKLMKTSVLLEQFSTIGHIIQESKKRKKRIIGTVADEVSVLNGTNKFFIQKIKSEDNENTFSYSFARYNICPCCDKEIINSSFYPMPEEDFRKLISKAKEKGWMGI